ncbi:hypothetical protein QFC21_004031 [Naganishia friedmannii]|uniref:Uncharacterized protein n=1 Tax=Naganishia friedmannii TaxID=89922 RepID=A0ACC2VKS8_9TREE|nr:hypothetical protein QFC21_004031 [Naganishia friedmannii]
MSPSSIDKEMDDVQRSFDAIQLNDTAEAMKKNKKARQRANKNNKPAALSKLPPELLDIIVGMVQQESLGSLANFNLCSKTLYAISLPMLWKEVVWKTNTWKYARVVAMVTLLDGSLSKTAYKAWNIANSGATMIPKFLSSYEAVDRAFIDWSISGKPLRKDMRRKIPDTRRFPPTALHDFVFDPDATLEVDMTFTKRSLDFHILLDFREEDQVDRLLRGKAIWRVFHLVQQHFAPSKLTFGIERGFIFYEVHKWLKTIMQVPLDNQGFTSESLKLHKGLLSTLQEHGANPDGPTIPTFLPVKIEISDLGEPSLPVPSCKHVEIDLEDAETRRVILISECFLGGCDHKGYRDGRLMTLSEHALWKSRMRPESDESRDTARSRISRAGEDARILEDVEVD